jgi:hypothetical protein
MSCRIHSGDQWRLPVPSPALPPPVRAAWELAGSQPNAPNPGKYLDSEYSRNVGLADRLGMFVAML